MTKSEVISAIGSQLESKVAAMKMALADSHEGATGDETKSEGKYDTRAIEAAYLAEAQGNQLALAEEALAAWKRFEPINFEPADQVGPGALVEVDQAGEITFYLLAPTAGGTMTTYLGCDLTVISPDSQLYQSLLDQRSGDQLPTPNLTILGLE